MSDHTRDLEEGILTDLQDRLSYASYLDLPRLLSAQHPRSEPQQHDELLFIIQHQTSELWLKLLLHELLAVRRHLAGDDLGSALKGLARVKRIVEVLTAQWSVLATLTPSEYAEFRPFLASSSGFQSSQYRAVEFVLGNKQPAMLDVFADDAPAHAHLSGLLAEPTVYDEVLRLVARRGLPVPASVLERDVTQAHAFVEELVPVLATVYRDRPAHWDLYETCETLVDLEDAFQLWRFRHMQTVQRTIGHQSGTGGSSGVPFLRRALDLTFFPELYAVRATVGS